MEICEVVVVGAGFAGTILARILHRLGVEVMLIERHEHPRFAIGESSTPLAAISLERLAQRFDMPDLGWLAAYGRWLEQLPEVRRGLKRGFTFYRHQRGIDFRDSPNHECRLLVAASPDNAVADSHWLRADVDHHLLQVAMAEGVRYQDRTEIKTLDCEADGRWLLSGTREDRPFELRAGIVIDGSGSGGFLSRALPIGSGLADVELDTALVFSHFEGLKDLPEISPVPYPEAKAAVHHLLDEGWLYVLPFDHGVASAGVLLRRQAMEELSAAKITTASAIWHEILSRYPVLQEQFESSRPTRPLGLMPRVQRRLQKSAGPGWALLPHTYSFLDPMFSTGIAWSLRAVERLALIFEKAMARGALEMSLINERFGRYDEILAAEARQMSSLLEGAYLAMPEFELFTAQSFLYFATVSFEEVDQRLFPEGHGGQLPAWRGFLGAGDLRLESIFAESKRRLAQLIAGERAPTAAERKGFTEWVAAVIADRNIAGLANPARQNLYPVDLDLLVERAALLGLTEEEMRASLPRLRGLGPED